jgi:hypothetical protein
MSSLSKKVRTAESLAQELVAYLVKEQRISGLGIVAFTGSFLEVIDSFSTPASPTLVGSSSASGGSRKRVKGEEVSTSPTASAPDKPLSAKWLPQLNTGFAHFWHVLGRCAWQTLPGAPGCPAHCTVPGCGRSQTSGQPNNLKRHLKDAHNGAVRDLARGAALPQQPLACEPSMEEVAFLHSLPPAAFDKIPAEWRALVPPPPRPRAWAAAAPPAEVAVAAQPPQLAALHPLAPAPPSALQHSGTLVAPVASMELAPPAAMDLFAAFGADLPPPEQPPHTDFRKATISYGLT